MESKFYPLRVRRDENSNTVSALAALREERDAVSMSAKILEEELEVLRKVCAVMPDRIFQHLVN